MGIDRSNKSIVRTIKTIKYVILKLIIINRFPGSSKFRSEAFHLCDVLLSTQVQLFCVGECTTDSGNPGLGLRGIELMERSPNISRMRETKHLRKNIFRERINQIANHLLIPHNPSVIGRVGYGDFLLILIINLESFRRRQIRSLQETHDPRTTERRQDLSLPIQEILTCQLRCRRRTNGNRSRGDRG
jgi:hypothetical protein